MLILCASFISASTALGDGPSGFSLDPSLITDAGSSPYSLTISSMDLPGTYFAMEAISSFICSYLGNYVYHLIDLFFGDNKRGCYTDDLLGCAVQEHSVLPRKVHDV